jgi:hypothetical protein
MGLREIIAGEKLYPNDCIKIINGKAYRTFFDKADGIFVGGNKYWDFNDPQPSFNIELMEE